jgi:hypothetical protein
MEWELNQQWRKKMTNTMECSCSCDYDGDYSSFSEQEIRKARKTHKCCECRAIIAPGQKYEYARGMYDHEFWTAKTCIPCTNIRRDYGCNAPYGELREYVEECLGFDYVTGEFCSWAEEEDSDAAT